MSSRTAEELKLRRLEEEGETDLRVLLCRLDGEIQRTFWGWKSSYKSSILL